MKDEYIIINKTELEKKLTELKTKLSEENDSFLPLQRIIGEDSGKIRMIQEVISKSTPLIPVVEQAFESGVDSLQDNLIQKLGLHYQTSEISSTTVNSTRGDLQQYIENLKLEI